MPRRHIVDWLEVDPSERSELTAAIGLAQQLILREHSPSSFSLHMDWDAGATHEAPHLQLQVVPRYRPDAGSNHLTTGDSSDPFWSALLPLLDRARLVDIAVAFVQPSGLELMEPLFRQLLRQSGYLRLVTGDSLGVTDPDALMRLLDLTESYPDQTTIRVFESQNQSYHPKAYRIVDWEGNETSFVGSSNITRSAMQAGVEWNYRLFPEPDRVGQREVRAAFEALLKHPKTRPLSFAWIQRYRLRRAPSLLPGGASLAAEITPLEETQRPVPHEVQQQAQQALIATREDGNKAGLVVLATGLGKTYLAAFDSEGFSRVLFVAHREEILNQARDTFRRVRPDAEIGLFTGQEKERHAPILFASVQTMAQTRHLHSFGRTDFDYIVVDEFHHASAATYRKLIEYFQPRFLLGLTATPERTDGGDLLGLCLENLVYRCDLVEGVRRKLLAPFHYYGVPDTVDYQKVRWKSGRFDSNDLDQALAVETRAQNALEQYRQRAGKRTLVFCASQRHCDFMDDFFRKHGLRSASIHSGPTSAPRAGSLKLLEEGQLDLICSVDMFNEGLDLPAVDTVMMLRPTESPIVWQQQFGRGLRKSEGKTHLTVIDYIGNHRIFLTRPELLGLTAPNVAALLQKLRNQASFKLPPDCVIDFDLEAIELLESLLKREPKDIFLAWYQGFKQIHERRPSALETLHQGYNPRAARQRSGSWLGFVEAQGDLDEASAAAYAQHRDFLNELETTKMSKSYKMLVARAMLNLEQMPGTVPIPQLAGEFASLVSRSAKLQADVSVSHQDDRAIETLLRKNPLHYLEESGKGYFRTEGNNFTCTVSPSTPALVALIDEVITWRLADYLLNHQAEGSLLCKVAQSNGRPIIFLPNRGIPDTIPHGPTPVMIDGKEHNVHFAKIAINVIQPKDGQENILPRILRGWFGPDAGQPGTMGRVTLDKVGDDWHLKPVGETLLASGAVVGQQYSREQIPKLFGLEFNPAIWNTGFVKAEKDIFLLVSLKKTGMSQEHLYEDRFIPPHHFQWQSQNRTTQDSKDGKLILDHEKLGVSVHLFVRDTKRGPFRYEGPVRFESWTGERPITVTWRLAAGPA